jgi:hypothetical protein
MRKNDKSGVVNDERLHCGPFVVLANGTGIGCPPVEVLIESGFVNGSMQLLQRIVNAFEFDDQDLFDAYEGGNNQFGMRIVIVSNGHRVTAVKSRRTDTHTHTLFLFTFKNIFMFPKT